MKPVGFPELAVLIVEDERFISGLIKRMLRNLGTTNVWDAPDGTEALRLLTGPLRPDLVICDVQMQPMDGVTFLGQLRSLADPLRAGLPVIMLTSVTQENTVRGTKGLGVSGYLVKPISPKQLTDRITAIFRF